MRARVWWGRNKAGPWRALAVKAIRPFRTPDRALAIALMAALSVLAVAFGCAPDAPEGGVPTHPGDRFAVTLEWDAPTTDAVGQPLQDLAGFRLYYRAAADPVGAETMLETDSVTRYTVEDLPAGSFVFSVTAVDVDGNESARSASVEVGVGG